MAPETMAETMAGTVERWAEDYIRTVSLPTKLAPPTCPTTWTRAPQPVRIDAPGRPPALEVVERAPRMPRSLRSDEARARVLHRFLHHELQAAELMAWALLAFPETPRAFREGLLTVLHDEVRHMQLYAAHIRQLGFEVGSFVVRDWFWQRVPSCETPAAFVACMGIGFEGGNLEHSARFAERFRAVGDEAGARIQDQVGQEEIAHVRFAVGWFRRFVGDLDFEGWVRTLPRPLSPMVMRGVPLHRERRRAAALDEPFLDALEAWEPA